MFADLTFWTGTIGMVLTCLFAVLRGGSVERQAGFVIAAAWLGSALAPVDLSRPLWTVMLIDAGLLLYLLYQAVFSGRHWTIGAAACQALILATHLAFFRNFGLEQWGYLTAYYVWSFGVLLCLLAGTLAKSRIKAHAE